MFIEMYMNLVKRKCASRLIHHHLSQRTMKFDVTLKHKENEIIEIYCKCCQQ
jgi:hypothetical protein